VTALPLLPLSPLPEATSADLARLLEGLDAPALWWLSGYTAALAAQHGAAAPRLPGALPARETPAQERLTIVYGSQTGNAKRLAEKLAQNAEASGLGVRLVRADAYPQAELKNERLLYVVVSTQGDGDPPDDSRGFVEFIAGRRAPQLPDLKYAVLALGDSSYPQFCVVGRKLDERLAALGAKRLVDRGEADLDIETVATPWLDRALSSAREALKSTAQPRIATVTPLRAVAPIAEWTRERPFPAEVLANQRITARDGTRDVRHVELSLESSGIAYEPGDALGVWPTNPAALVDAILEAQKLDGDTQVSFDGASRSLRSWLADKRELTRVARPFVATHAAHAQHRDLNRLLAPDHAADLSALLQSHQVIDLLHAFPADWSADELVAALRPLKPRLYSIASSRKSVGEEAHLTVARIDYEAFGIGHVGAASDYLAMRADGERVPVFIESNERFRLPKDASRDIVMIGPGTGVAPFRGFVQERTAAGARGRNWLFFGNPHFRSDFLYQIEWQAALKSGSLHRLDLAFSRDQSEKIYVQQRLREHGRDLYEWIERGAHVYVCGDATRMAKDVHAALVDIVVEHSGKDREEAEEYIGVLQRDGRYARDVY